MADEWLIAFHTVVLAEAAGAIAIKFEELDTETTDIIALGLDNLRSDTDHEAYEGFVAFQAVVFAGAARAIALKINASIGAMRSYRCSISFLETVC